MDNAMYAPDALGLPNSPNPTGQPSQPSQPNQSMNIMTAMTASPDQSTAQAQALPTPPSTAMIQSSQAPQAPSFGEVGEVGEYGEGRKFATPSHHLSHIIVILVFVILGLAVVVGIALAIYYLPMINYGNRVYLSVEVAGKTMYLNNDAQVTTKKQKFMLTTVATGDKKSHGQIHLADRFHVADLASKNMLCLTSDNAFVFSGTCQGFGTYDLNPNYFYLSNTSNTQTPPVGVRSRQKVILKTNSGDQVVAQPDGSLKRVDVTSEVPDGAIWELVKF